MNKLAVALTFASVASGALYTDNAVQQKSLWESFKSQHGKKYDTMEEESRRFYLFVENLRTVDVRNSANIKAGGAAIHGITKFSDLSQAEFESHYLTADASMKNKKASKDGKELPRKMIPVDKYPINTSLGFVDWTGRYTTPVKNQGKCGSCWAFSAIEQIESDAMRTLGAYFELSAEQVTQCDGSSGGCNGGWPNNAYNYIHNVGGIETEASYPYTSGNDGVTGTCHHDGSKFVLGVDAVEVLQNENSMGGFVSQAGPISVCLDASNFNSYTGGVIYSCGQEVNHCIQMVGVEVDSVWKGRNQWGASWGEGGYVRFAFGQNMCNIAYDPTVVSVHRK